MDSVLHPPEYDFFYRVVHAYSEALLAPIYAIQTSAVLTRRLCGRMVEENDYERIAEVYRLSEQLEGRTADIPERVRRTFWPKDAIDLPDREAFHALNRERWYPYNQDVWLALQLDLSQIVLPWLRMVEPALRWEVSLVNAEIEDWQRSGVPDALWSLQRLVSGMEKNTNKVRAALNSEFNSYRSNSDS